MAEEPGGGGPGHADEARSAARSLAALVPPIRFAVRDGWAGLARLSGFEALVRGAVERAVSAGAARVPALERLLALSQGFDALAPDERKRALVRIAGQLSTLVPLPEDLCGVAAQGRAQRAADREPGPGSAGAAGAVAGRALPGAGGARATAAAPARRNPTARAAGVRPAGRAGPPAPVSAPSGQAAAAPARAEAPGTAVRRPSATSSASPAAPQLPPLGDVAAARESAADRVREDGSPAARVAEPGPPRDAEERARRRALLDTPLASLPRAHPAPRALLEERGHATVEAALTFWPKAYQDRSRVDRIAELRVGAEGIALGEVRAVRAARMRSGKPLLRVELDDGTGRLDLVFFNPPPWRQKQLGRGETLLVSGKVTEGFGGRRQMAQPEVEKVGSGDSASFGRIVPFYAGPADHQHPALRKLMKRLCDELAPFSVDDLPDAIRARRGLLPIAQALREAHFPPPGTDPLHAAERATPAFRRLVFEELFFLQLALARRRQGVRREPGIRFEAAARGAGALAALLPFTLTTAQRRALDAVLRDMARPEPMNRLLQGDVGSGKTAVAFLAMLAAARSGYQAVLMAPTELLAEQHVRTMRGWLQGTDTSVVLVGAQARGKEQREARAALASGRAALAVGTHALLERDVPLKRLGLVVVDEQHRFGVVQRATLIAKGTRPDVLVMTATPIPRTLALAFHGDLDQSVIDELPPGRTPVRTEVFGDSRRKRAYQLARAELERGRQAYVVYPLVAESEKSDLADATSGAEELARVFAPHRVGLVHGRMGADEKDDVMTRFREGDVRVLVATTVIEVGIDVPNATVMIVEHAERFGLSQLHQLRGRVGRGAEQSHCLLVAHFKRAGDEGRERLRVMESTSDGFEIARADLRIRGPGELLGTRQSGQALLEIADLYRDGAILEEAREEAFGLCEEDPDLGRPEHAAAAEALALRWSRRLSLAQVG